MTPLLFVPNCIFCFWSESRQNTILETSLILNLPEIQARVTVKLHREPYLILNLPVIQARVILKQHIGSIFDFEFACDSAQSHAKILLQQVRLDKNTRARVRQSVGAIRVTVN